MHLRLFGWRTHGAGPESANTRERRTGRLTVQNYLTPADTRDLETLRPKLNSSQ
jgi:hypothetical protein